MRLGGAWGCMLGAWEGYMRGAWWGTREVLGGVQERRGEESGRMFVLLFQLCFNFVFKCAVLIFFVASYLQLVVFY